MTKHFFTKEEYDNIPNNLKNSPNLIMKKYNNGYSIRESGKEELYFFTYQKKGTDTSGKKKFLQAFRTPLAGIIAVTPLNTIFSYFFDLRKKLHQKETTEEPVSVEKEYAMIALNSFLCVSLLASAIFLPKFWDKSESSSARYGLNFKDIDESDIEKPIKLDDLGALEKRNNNFFEFQMNEINSNHQKSPQSLSACSIKNFVSSADKVHTENSVNEFNNKIIFLSLESNFDSENSENEFDNRINAKKNKSQIYL